jgi:hypothetical protein
LKPLRLSLVFKIFNVEFKSQNINYNQQNLQFQFQLHRAPTFLKFSAVHFPETVVNFYQTTRRQIPQEINLKIQLPEPKLIHRYSREAFFSDAVRNCRPHVAVCCNFAMKRNKITWQSAAIFRTDTKSFAWWAASVSAMTVLHKVAC